MAGGCSNSLPASPESDRDQELLRAFASAKRCARSSILMWSTAQAPHTRVAQFILRRIKAWSCNSYSPVMRCDQAAAVANTSVRAAGHECRVCSSLQPCGTQSVAAVGCSGAFRVRWRGNMFRSVSALCPLYVCIMSALCPRGQEHQFRWELGCTCRDSAPSPKKSTTVPWHGNPQAESSRRHCSNLCCAARALQ